METVNLNLKIEFVLHPNCMHGHDGYRSGVRPNHWIVGKDYTFIGQVDFLDRELLKPGESCVATLTGFVANKDKELFKSGFAWHVCEANKIMGYAKVI